MTREKIPTVFELSVPGRHGVDLPAPDVPLADLPTGELRAECGLPELSQLEVMRHYTALSQRNFGVDSGFYPLGSCTMKFNPKVNEVIARLAGFAETHPLQDPESVPGNLALMFELQRWLAEIGGFAAVSLQPAAGAHGEFTGLLMMRAYHRARGDTKRARILIPDSAHGTNPASTTMAGFSAVELPSDARGNIDLDAVRAACDDTCAGIMMTNPNTLGLFEEHIGEVVRLVHDCGGLVYGDGANLNALAGIARPGDLGVDVMHYNLHKTFSTPHGGGGPGAGPVVLSERLAAFAPLPLLLSDEAGFRLVEDRDELPKGAKPFGRMCAFHGQMGMFVRALSYMLSHGRDGVRQASEDAVLSANYILASLKDVMSAPFGNGPCMHEALFDDTFLEGSGVTTLDFAKAMIDEGYHPMTMYFPLVVHGAMLIEPTESESKASLDLFIAVLRDLAMAAKRGDTARFTGAPYYAPRRRLDETRAARAPVLRWTRPAPQQEAAE